MYLLLDIGGTSMRIGKAHTKETIDEFGILPTPTNFEEAMNTLHEAAEKIVANETITNVVCGVPGPLNSDKSEISNAANLSGWNNQPLQKKLEELLAAPVQIENDAALGGLGEAIFGAGQGKNIVAYITVSTGIGGTRIVGGKIDHAASGFEPGHQIIMVDGETCSCGARGHLEAYASGGAIQKKYGKKPSDVKDPKSWQEITTYLAIGLNNIIVHWSPDIIILGGSVSKDINLELLNTSINNLKPVFKNMPPIVKASLENKSGLYGGLALLA